jgi:hypothetical protein
MLVALLGPAHSSLFAQDSTPPAQLEIGGMGLSGSLRARLESWDWFGSNPNGTYTYPGSILRIALGQARRTREWQVELAVPLLVALPEQPAGAAPEGLGANYFVANNRSTNAVTLFVKQAFARFTDLWGVTGQSLKIGRMEFFDGAEVTPKHATLAAVKRDRVALRLLGNFGFTHVGRSLDGAQYALDRPWFNVTVLAARPTTGVFQVDGWGELNVNVFYGAFTRQATIAGSAAEWRLFGLGYHDYRDDVVKTDNRSLAARRADTSHLKVGTFGGHYLQAVAVGPGTNDVLFWGAVQIGSWGELAHRAGAVAAEVGWQPALTLSPWIRGGFNFGSGDGDPTDTIHATFFQVLPTPRLYARFPFFNMMNTADAFGELILRPSTRLTIRSDGHALRLADHHDLWYQGGGVFQRETFGYAGLPSGGHSGLATLYDSSVDVRVSPRVSPGFYYAYARGGSDPFGDAVPHANDELALRSAHDSRGRHEQTGLRP